MEIKNEAIPGKVDQLIKAATDASNLDNILLVSYDSST